MSSLECILRDQFGFKDGHFDEYGRVHVNSMDGSISSMPAASTQPASIFLPITDVLKVGQEMKIMPSERSRKRKTLGILDINSEGLSAVSLSGAFGFFPWEILSFGLSTPSQLELTSLAETQDVPQSTLRAASGHMERRLAEEKAAVRVTEGLLAAIGEQMKPSI